MASTIASLQVAGNEASQALVNLDQQHARAKQTLLGLRAQAVDLQSKFAGAVTAAGSLPDGPLATEAQAKAAALEAERVAFIASIESDLTALGIDF